jgi:16S rRNA (cytidine1402-2'-O)-methyltransferase
LKNLFLVPTPIYEEGIDDISPRALNSIQDLRYFIVENLKTARRCLRKMGFRANFDEEVQFYEIDKHDKNQSQEIIKSWMKSGFDIGVLSEAGLPCIADPGSKFVALAHTFDYSIQPLSGPSSILLALISSGFNGQNFAFNGYLPIDKIERAQKLKSLEQKVRLENQTQIFMETPFRNPSFFEDILKTCSGDLSLSISSNIGAQDAIIKTYTIQDWKKISPPDIHKKPTIFCLGT